MSVLDISSVRTALYGGGMAKTELAEHRIVALLPKSLLSKVKQAAKRNGRSLSGEVRFALTEKYLGEQQ